MSSVRSHEGVSKRIKGWIHRRRASGAFFRLLALGVAYFVTSASSCGIREDELQCEETVAHLQGCCPGYDPFLHDIDCTYKPPGPCVSEELPSVGRGTARCIRDLSCAAIRAEGLCEQSPPLCPAGVQ
jgi:hypothetical protein